ncbi:MAG TPA: CDP-alcohol phosphatidyltransferase family protein [Gemmatimonadaceae bacterium]|nr:CDP-alcohol phosphatidyltransferase family protein [Gemmatimonadaceae bacterium]
MRAVSELRSLPNAISLSRLLLAAGFIVAGSGETRIIIVMIALATDYLDGWIARRSRSMTRAGALLDPFADRVFVLVGVAVFLFEGALTTLEYFIMISRDLMTAIGFLVSRAVPSLRRVAFHARFPGKLVTVLQLASFIAILIRPAAATPMIWVVAVASAWAIGDYTWALWRARVR